MPRSTKTRSAPEKSDLPEKRNRAVPGPVGEARVSFDVPLVTITPVLGGSYRTRHVCEWEPIRAPSIRGHLRFWWRVIHGHGHEFEKSEDLFKKEKILFGGLTPKEQNRSSIEISISGVRNVCVEKDQTDYRTRGFYALWPSRGSIEKNEDPAHRLSTGCEFVMRVTCPASMLDDLEKVVSAWISFGGYGARTRRGLGSICVRGGEQEARKLLLASVDDARLQSWIKKPGAGHESWSPDLPKLAGAILFAAKPMQQPIDAWLEALRWLSDFRQSPAIQGQAADRFARMPKGPQRRPGRSNWPEADKIRALRPRGNWTHRTRHNPTPVWPRAGFGLPIVGQFVNEGGRASSFTIAWEESGSRGDDSPGFHDRLASPLIVKALPLQSGQYAPIALWLHRSYPSSGSVGLQAGEKSLQRESLAAFDELVASGDSAHFAPLEQHKNDPPGERLRGAFFSWLEQNKLAQRVTP